MRLYLMRHGEARVGRDDDARTLSDAGHMQALRVAAFLGEVGVRVEQVFHSGKTRARQTAECLAAQVFPEGEIEAISGIAPEDSVAAFAEQLATWNTDTAVVGHLPFMGLLTGLLTTGNGHLPVSAFSTATVVCLEQVGVGRYQMIWMVNPELLGVS